MDLHHATYPRDTLRPRMKRRNVSTPHPSVGSNRMITFRHMHRRIPLTGLTFPLFGPSAFREDGEDIVGLVT